MSPSNFVSCFICDLLASLPNLSHFLHNAPAPCLLLLLILARFHSKAFFLYVHPVFVLCGLYNSTAVSWCFYILVLGLFFPTNLCLILLLATILNILRRLNKHLQLLLHAFCHLPCFHSINQNSLHIQLNTLIFDFVSRRPHSFQCFKNFSTSHPRFFCSPIPIDHASKIPKLIQFTLFLLWTIP